MGEGQVTMPTAAEDNEYFKTMINLIPSHFYFDQEMRDKLISQRVQDGSDGSDEEGVEKKPESKKRAKKRSAEERNAYKKKWKKMRLDPEQNKKVSELHEQLYGDEENLSETREKRKKKKRSAEEDVTLKSSSATIEELRQKLQDKISMMQAHRKNLGKTDYMEKKRLKRRESKVRSKMRRKEKNKTDRPDNGGPKKGPKAPAQTPSHKPVFNKDGKMVFSKFDFSETGDRGDAAPAGKDFKKLIEKAKKQKEKVQKVKDKDESAGKALEEKVQWEKVLKKAQGVKVRDDPLLLKKAAKKKEKRKEKSQKTWKERESKVKGKMKEKQDKRKENLQKRKQGRIDKKIKKSKKKGRMVPGF